MIDLETMSTRADAAIVSIGAVNVGSGAEFYMVVDDWTGRIEPSTVVWWMRQSIPVRMAALSQPTAHEDMLKAFTKWLGEQRVEGDCLRLWGDEDFDTVILKEAYARAGLAHPWTYQEARGLRTAKEIMGIDDDAFEWGERVEHVAIDCARQAAIMLRTAFAAYWEKEAGSGTRPE